MGVWILWSTLRNLKHIYKIGILNDVLKLDMLDDFFKINVLDGSLKIELTSWYSRQVEASK